MKAIRIIRSDDWTAMYVDERCVYQHHDIELEKFLELVKEHVGIELDVVSGWLSREDDERAIKEGEFPVNLRDFKCIEWDW